MSRVVWSFAVLVVLGLQPFAVGRCDHGVCVHCTWVLAAFNIPSLPITSMDDPTLEGSRRSQLLEPGDTRNCLQ